MPCVISTSIFAMKNFVIIAAVIFGGLLALHGPAPESAAAAEPEVAQTVAKRGTSFTTLTSAQLAAMLSKKDFFFVNVHIPYEGEIENTDEFIAYDKIASHIDKLPKDKSAKIVLYCRSDRMSEIAARELTQLGYSRVSHLAGGMVDWKKSGYGIVEK